MQVALNLSISTGPRERYAWAWAVPLSLSAAAALIYISMVLVGGLKNYRNYHRTLVGLQDQERQLNFREAKTRLELNRPQSKEVYRQAQALQAQCAGIPAESGVTAASESTEDRK